MATRGTLGVVLAFVLLGSFAACRKGTDANGNPPVGTVDDAAGFYLNYRKSDDYVYDVHKSDSFTESCVAVAGEDIECYLDGEELDLYYQGYTLQYNVPKDMCSYVSFAPYFYWNFEAGDGPTDVQVDTDSNNDVGVDTDDNGVINSAATTKCEYDYSPDGPNCCTGVYTKRTRAWDDAANAYDTPVTTTDVEWGGTPSSCIAGPAVDTEPKFKDGFPRWPTYIFVENVGVNKDYKVAAPISFPRGSNAYVANYFNTADHGGGLPVSLRDVSTVRRNYYVNPYYQLRCLDRAQELIAQITFFVREWNYEPDFTARASVPTGHDTVGVEDTPFGSFNINDRWDWKDFGVGFPGETF